jgi:hypothetical protein
MNKEEIRSDFEKWLESQTPEVKTLIQERFSVLERTISATREERDSYSKDLKDLAKKVEKGSEAETKIAELSDKLVKTERKYTFLEKATAEGCVRPSVAFAVASHENLWDNQGEPDWKRIKESAPELFKVSNLKSNAGAGTKTVVADEDPNTAIRAAAHKN